jgi:hypothetical protein
MADSSAAHRKGHELLAEKVKALENALQGVAFELDRAVRLGTRPPSAMLADFERILALASGGVE